MNDQHESWWAHLAPWIAGVAMIIIMFALPTIVWQEYHYNKVSHGYHVQTVQILNEHTNTLNEVKQLRSEVTDLVKLYGPQLTAGQQKLIAQLDWITCTLSSSASACGTPP